MPVFGKSLFETVLDGFVPEQADEEEEDMRSAPGRGLRYSSSFLPGTPYERDTVPNTLADLYEDFAAPPPEGVIARPAWLDRLSPVDIAEDLGLSTGMKEDEIRERRRAFARLNHPDRVGAEYREAATIRMTIANQLVDAALARF